MGSHRKLYLAIVHAIRYAHHMDFEKHSITSLRGKLEGERLYRDGPWRVLDLLDAVWEIPGDLSRSFQREANGRGGDPGPVFRFRRLIP